LKNNMSLNAVSSLTGADHSCVLTDRRGIISLGPFLTCNLVRKVLKRSVSNTFVLVGCTLTDRASTAAFT
ncbi:hypothetical protein, partial [Vibrio sp. 10N.247.310.17]|uniref:hypothetical protein n=1 Tax=Vibrio sp. 10N.247.310.17 TaxID=3229979 RepID=UPI00354E08ED